MTTVWRKGGTSLRGGCGLFTLAALGLSTELVRPVSAIAGSGSGPEH